MLDKIRNFSLRKSLQKMLKIFLNEVRIDAKGERYYYYGPKGTPNPRPSSRGKLPDNLKK